MQEQRGNHPEFNIALDYFDAEGKYGGATIHSCGLNAHGLSCPLVISDGFIHLKSFEGGRIEMYAIGPDDVRFEPCRDPPPSYTAVMGHGANV